MTNDFRSAGNPATGRQLTAKACASNCTAKLKSLSPGSCFAMYSATMSARKSPDSVFRVFTIREMTSLSSGLSGLLHAARILLNSSRR